MPRILHKNCRGPQHQNRVKIPAALNITRHLPEAPTGGENSFIMILQKLNILTAALFLFLWIIVPCPVCFSSPGILEKSYKRYSLYTYMDNDILCEPYTVKKGDWVYKILKSKGEISKTDFSLFLKIFQTVNPDIKDIDTLLHGQTILIP